MSSIKNPTFSPSLITLIFTLFHILIIQVLNRYMYLTAWATYALRCFTSVFRKRFFAFLQTNIGVAKSTSDLNESSLISQSPNLPLFGSSGRSTSSEHYFGNILCMRATVLTILSLLLCGRVFKTKCTFSM